MKIRNSALINISVMSVSNSMNFMLEIFMLFQLLIIVHHSENVINQGQLVPNGSSNKFVVQPTVVFSIFPKVRCFFR
jgi:hypothetical protein